MNCNECHFSFLSLYRLPNIVQYLCEPLQTGLKDGYGYVRRIAVMGVAKLYYVAPDIVTSQFLNSMCMYYYCG